MFHFLQVIPKETTASTTTLLIIAIGAMAAAIIWLALYIRTLHNKHAKIQTENTKQFIAITEEVVKAVTNVDATTKLNSKSIELTGNAIVQAVSSLDRTVDDLHKQILRSTQPLRP